ncbi:hypothetical protein ACN28I_37890 [Archangium gephyra]|uniref:hypothetical protein n=1 Tax=Archangium gephyra TaxID=48 RepID=UPI003B784DEF
MTTQSFLYDTQEVIGKLWNKYPSPEHRQLLGVARDALFYVYVTGKRYRLEDFRKDIGSGLHCPPDTQERPGDDFTGLDAQLNSTECFFKKLRDETTSARQRNLLQAILDTLLFISSTGQHSGFSEYLEHLEADAPPYAIASFNTKEEVEAWLKNHPAPPDFAHVLVANAYHDVVYERERNFRRMLRSRTLEYHLADLKKRHPPAAVASFATLEDAEAWLKAQPTPARWAWVSIAGEPYLAVYHPNLQHRALYPLSMANGYEVEDDEEEPGEP